MYWIERERDDRKSMYLQLKKKLYFQLKLGSFFFEFISPILLLLSKVDFGLMFREI